MTHRYFVETPITGPSAVLGDAEAHHLAHVMRLKAGAEVVLFDGGGAEFLARVTQVGKRETSLEVVERRLVDREMRRRITLCTALPRGDRQKRLVEKAVEMGAARLVPLHTERAVVEPDAGTCAKLRRAVIEASKQCGRNELMEIGNRATWRRSSPASGRARCIVWRSPARRFRWPSWRAKPRPRPTRRPPIQRVANQFPTACSVRSRPRATRITKTPSTRGERDPSPGRARFPTTPPTALRR